MVYQEQVIWLKALLKKFIIGQKILQGGGAGGSSGCREQFQKQTTKININKHAVRKSWQHAPPIPNTDFSTTTTLSRRLVKLSVMEDLWQPCYPDHAAQVLARRTVMQRQGRRAEGEEAGLAGKERVRGKGGKNRVR
ncbi:hypothetical protein Pmani_031660 [Petrolisthes manimaculis]|uniref:Uncharacterized protein n=1 Tax=Petrolisthes manimaculis TaxID=1843537 RepID=A0AAE1NT80_9EUCA|nr:hypothetical protein Pmani_031660 [Petrolisthes manimaculis]